MILYTFDKAETNPRLMPEQAFIQGADTIDEVRNNLHDGYKPPPKGKRLVVHRLLTYHPWLVLPGHFSNMAISFQIEQNCRRHTIRHISYHVDRPLYDNDPVRVWMINTVYGAWIENETLVKRSRAP